MTESPLLGDLLGDTDESFVGDVSSSSLFGVLLRPNGVRLLGLGLLTGEGDLKQQ